MEIKQTLNILGLTENSSLQELTAVFRKLVKKYHPDLNQDKPEWSNQKMLFLNEAYDSAYEYLTKPKTERDSTENIEEKKAKTDKNLTFSKGMAHSLRFLYDGISIYYQYGLENIALRFEGTRRNRFRSSIRRIKKSFSILKPVAELHLNKTELNQLEIVVNFIRHFYKSLHITDLRPKDNSRYERKAFQHLQYGSKLVDNVIKELMFKEFMELYKQGRLTENIKLAEAELNAVIIDYSDALCLREAEIKKELLLSFLDVAEMNEMEMIKLF